MKVEIKCTSRKIAKEICPGSVFIFGNTPYIATERFLADTSNENIHAVNLLNGKVGCFKHDTLIVAVNPTLVIDTLAYDQR